MLPIVVKWVQTGTQMHANKAASTAFIADMGVGRRFATRILLARFGLICA